MEEHLLEAHATNEKRIVAESGKGLVHLMKTGVKKEDEEELRKQMFDHGRIELSAVVKCKLCPLVCLSMTALFEHVFMVHPDLFPTAAKEPFVDGLFRCCYCGLPFGAESVLRRHLEDCHLQSTSVGAAKDSLAVGVRESSRSSAPIEPYINVSILKIWAQIFRQKSLFSANPKCLICQVFFYACVCVSVCVSFRLCLSVYVFVCLSVCMSVRL